MEEDKRRFGRWDIETRLETVQGNSHHFEYQRYGSSEESGWLELEMKSSLRSAIEHFVDNIQTNTENGNIGVILNSAYNHSYLILRKYGWGLAYDPLEVDRLKRDSIDVGDVLEEYSIGPLPDKSWIQYMEQESKKNSKIKHLQHREEGKLIEKNEYSSESKMNDGRYKISVINPDLYWEATSSFSNNVPNIVYVSDKQIADSLFKLYSSFYSNCEILEDMRKKYKNISDLVNDPSFNGDLSMFPEMMSEEEKRVFEIKTELLLIEINKILDDKNIDVDYADMIVKESRKEYVAGETCNIAGTYYHGKDMILSKEDAIDHELGHRKSAYVIDEYVGTDLTLIGPLKKLLDSCTEEFAIKWSD